jgi:hypothetical protein
MDIDNKLISLLLDKPIAFNRSFALICNSATAGLLLSQLFYWAKTMNFNEFYKKSDDLQEECVLGRREFENARKKIIDLNIFSIIKKGVPCKTYYQINFDVLIELLKNQANINNNSVQTSMYETYKLDCTKSTNCNVPKVQTVMDETAKLLYITENNTKNKKENNTNIISEIATNVATNKKVEKIDFNFEGYNDNEVEAIKLWIKYKKTKPIQIKSLEREIAKLRADNDIIAVIDRSIANSWAGLFPLNKQTTKNTIEDPHERVRRIMRNPNAQDWDAPNDVF